MGKKRKKNIAPSCYASLFSSHLSPPLALPFLPVSPSFSSAAPVKTPKRMWDGEEDGETKRWMEGGREGGMKRGGRLSFSNISMLRVSALSSFFSSSPFIPHSIPPSVSVSSLVTAIIPSKHSSLRA